MISSYSRSLTRHFCRPTTVFSSFVSLFPLAGTGTESSFLSDMYAFIQPRRAMEFISVSFTAIPMTERRDMIVALSFSIRLSGFHTNLYLLASASSLVPSMNATEKTSSILQYAAIADVIRWKIVSMFGKITSLMYWPMVLYEGRSLPRTYLALRSCRPKSSISLRVIFLREKARTMNANIR